MYNLVSMCTRCRDKTTEQSKAAYGMCYCYFCGERVVTGHVSYFHQEIFESDLDREMTITKVKGGLYLDMIGEGYVWMSPDEYYQLPYTVSSHLREAGMI